MESPTADAFSTTTPAIVFVDDEPKSVKYFVLAFGSQFPILTAGSVAEARGVMDEAADRIGVLVSDQRMPVATGVQLMAWAREHHPNVVRVLTTAYAELDDAVAAVNSGEIHRYVVKPWDLDALGKDLRDCVELFRRRRHEQELLQTRRSAMRAQASHIAHELSTPLVTIGAAATTLMDYWPILLQSYKTRAAADAQANVIPERVLQSLRASPETILGLVERSKMLIDLLLMNSRDHARERSDPSRFGIAGCVETALKTYPFRDGEADLVRLEGLDFEVYGAEILLHYVLYNLFKNALFAIRQARRGEVVITMAPGAEGNRLLVRDTGCGIAPEVLPHIFDEFFTGKDTGSGTGMGLAFCRRVMPELGGEIQCRSREGELTEMTLQFTPLGKGD